MIETETDFRFLLDFPPANIILILHNSLSYFLIGFLCFQRKVEIDDIDREKKHAEKEITQ